MNWQKIKSRGLIAGWKVQVGLPGLRRKREMQERREEPSAMLWKKNAETLGSLREFGPIASATDRWPRMFGRV